MERGKSAKDVCQCTLHNLSVYQIKWSELLIIFGMSSLRLSDTTMQKMSK